MLHRWLIICSMHIMMHVAAVVVLLAMWAHAAAPPNPVGRIYQYTSTVRRNGESPASWTPYDTAVVTNGTRSSATDFDDNVIFDPVGAFTAPFFQLDAASWYISSNGFISPMSYGMCGYFPTSYSTYTGLYQLSTSLLGGGSWPSIQLFTTDLNPPTGGTIRKLVYNKSVGGTTMRVAVVDFSSVKLWDDNPSTAPAITGQLELWPNGTIISRYTSIPFSSTAPLPTSGITWSSRQRTYGPSMTDQSITSIRYDPVLDPCQDFEASCSVCIGATLPASVTGSCVWCQPQRKCVHSRVAADYCATSQQNSCNVTSTSQQFYNLTQLDSVFNATSGEWIDDFFGPNVTDALPSTASMWSAGNATTTSAVINLTALPFSLFYNPPVKNSSSSSIRKTVYVTRYGTLSFSSTGQACDILGYCSTGAYTNAMLGVATYNTFSVNTTVSYAVLPARIVGDLYCGAAAVTVMSRCPQAVAIVVSSVQKYLDTNTRATFPSLRGALWSYVFLLDAEGRAAIKYLSASPEEAQIVPTASRVPYTQYPTPDMGLFKGGATDGSSIRVPATSVTVGSALVYTPLPTCDDCGIGGVCNISTLRCQCLEGFVGNTCSECTAGYYGSRCTACPNCGSYGTCVDGRSGSGACTCSPPYSGRLCTVRCASAPYNCSSCNDVGGYCECGICHCNQAKGWSGDGCWNWSDPCLAFSLDGCPVCTAYRSVTCRYCHDGYCAADPTQDGIGTAPVNSTAAQYTGSCGLYYTANQSSCGYAQQTVAQNSGVAVIIVIIIFGGLGFSACFVLIFICAFRKPRVNALVGNAITGTPDFQFPRREREVIQMVLIPPQGPRGKPVQGIPLRQMPLKELYLYQQQQRAEHHGTGRNLRDWNLQRE